MGEFKVGDIVARKSYGYDVFFKIINITQTEGGNIVTLKGISYRIEADAPEDDLEIQTDSKVREYRERSFRMAESSTRNSRDVERSSGSYYFSRYRGYSKKAYYRDTSKDENGGFKRPGKVLHLDGDKEYLDDCIEEYSKLGLDVIGHYVPEKDQPSKVVGLLKEYRPDILVLTGHDSIIKGQENFTDLEAYRTSKYFIDAVKEARGYVSDMDALVIFAGACQSMYSELIRAGANFASSPFRDLIHALDPVKVCQKVAYTGIEKVLSAEEVISNTITGKNGIGGVQTRGKYREGFPAGPYQ